MMPTHIGWSDIALRLLLTTVAGAFIGIDRGEHGRPAGLRTTLLVCLAASVSMIQVNLLLPTAGRASDSFVVMDLMRLPLGILTGMGFIGAGAVLRKDNMVLGVTTAATLWFVTIIGLCFGGGQIGLGVISTVLALFVLEALKPVERAWKQERQGNLTIVVGNKGASETAITKIVVAAGYRITCASVVYDPQAAQREVRYTVKWRGSENETQPPAFVTDLANMENTRKVTWNF